MNLRLWIEFEKQLKSVSWRRLAESVLMMMMMMMMIVDETGNPYRLDSNETGEENFLRLAQKSS